MDKLVAFFKNVWFRRGVAVVCWGYTALMVWIAWLTFGYYFEFENATSLFVLYLFVNIAALGLMILSRKQVITMINCMLLPPIIFTIVIFGFGNWYIILPPLVVVIAMFFINAANETLKTVLGTFYLLMYVIGVVAYVAINLFMGKMTVTGLDLTLRDADYEKLSPSGEYRIVRYVDRPGERRTAAYYVEETAEDVEIPFGLCKKVFGSMHVHTASYGGKSDDPIFWTRSVIDGLQTEVLDVEGSIRVNPMTVKKTSEEDENSIPVFTGLTSGSAEAPETEDKTAEAVTVE